MARVELLGVPIDALTCSEAQGRLLEFLQETSQHHIMTPNSEMLVLASHSPPFRSLLQYTALNIPDSSGLLLMARFLGERIPVRIAGVDAVTQLCSVLGADFPVFLLGGREGIAQSAAEALRRRNSYLRIVGTYAGTPRDEDAPEILARINAAAPKLLLVAFGAPAQDLWIAKHLKALPSVRVAMGVGGTFDFLAGASKRAPLFLQRVGLEWAWRLLMEPWRVQRIFRAVFVFPWLVMRYGRNAPTRSPKS